MLRVNNSDLVASVNTIASGVVEIISGAELYLPSSHHYSYKHALYSGSFPNGTLRPEPGADFSFV